MNPEIHKKVKGRKKIMEVKKWVIKDLEKKIQNWKLLKITQAAQKSCLGGATTEWQPTTNIAEWQLESLHAVARHD